MSATGILRAANVVFYHPLDNFTEHTQVQTWAGAGGVVPGKIGTPPTAVSAVTADTLGYGSVNIYDTSNEQHEMVAIDSSRVLLAYKDSTSRCEVRVGPWLGRTSRGARRSRPGTTWTRTVTRSGWRCWTEAAS